MNKTTIYLSGFVVMMLVACSAPTIVSAQTVSYQPRTQNELLAYLYGRISMLLEIKAVLEKNGTLTQTDISKLGSYLEFETKSATDIAATTAVLRGEVLLYGTMTATVWFEYGRDEDFLDLRTAKVSVKTAYERAVRTTVKNLLDDERYYYRVVVLGKDGFIRYGEIHAFRTDELDN